MAGASYTHAPLIHTLARTLRLSLALTLRQEEGVVHGIGGLQQPDSTPI
jgi:hypothetical protein